MRRRSFITAAAGLTAGVASSAQARKPAIIGRVLDREFLRIGVVGLGPWSHAADFIRVINNQSVPSRAPLRVTAVWGHPDGYAASFCGSLSFVESRTKMLAERHNRERMQWEYQVQHFVDSPEDMIDEVDGVFVCDPDNALALARPFLERGMPVYVDRPVAWSLNEAQELISLAHAHGAVLVTGSYLPRTQAFRSFASRIDRNTVQHYYFDNQAGGFTTEMASGLESALMLSGGGVESCITTGMSWGGAHDVTNMSPVMVHMTYRQRIPGRDRIVGTISSWHGAPHGAWMKVHMDRNVLEQGLIEAAEDEPLVRDEQQWLPLIREIAHAFESGNWPETDQQILEKVRVTLMAHKSGMEEGQPIGSTAVSDHELPRCIGEHV